MALQESLLFQLCLTYSLLYPALLSSSPFQSPILFPQSLHNTIYFFSSFGDLLLTRSIPKVRTLNFSSLSSFQYLFFVFLCSIFSPLYYQVSVVSIFSLFLNICNVKALILYKEERSIEKSEQLRSVLQTQRHLHRDEAQRMSHKKTQRLVMTSC